jgi:hypothetical protein
VLSTALFWAMGSFGYPALVAQDNARGEVSTVSPETWASIGLAEDSTSLAVCQVDDSSSAPSDEAAPLPSPTSSDTQVPLVSTQTSDQIFADLSPTFDQDIGADPLARAGLPSSFQNSNNLSNAAAGASSVAPSPDIYNVGAGVAQPLPLGPGAAQTSQTGNSPAALAASLGAEADAGSAALPAVHSAALPTTTRTTPTTSTSAQVTAAQPAAEPSQASSDSSTATADAGGGNAVPLLVAQATAAPNAHPTPQGANGAPPFSPQQIQTAYGFNNVTNQGAGQTIYIVDAYNDPNISKDLQTFDAQWSLPNPNLTVHKMSSRIRNSISWGLEESLDVEWAHAIAPQANITLVEATNSSFTNLFNAVDWATNNGAHVVSMSWGATDFSGESSYDSHFNHSGVSYVASAGDTGAVVDYPSASPYVLSVGGTSLTLNTNNTYASESAWSSGGGGASKYESLPTYQKNYGLNYSGRATPDVAYNADPNTGVYVYDTYYPFGGGWFEVGGTSAGAPQWAALIALANQSRSTPLSTNNLTSRTEYNAATGSAYASNYHDVTTGSNGNPAGPGYDLATGVGSPQANNLVPWLISNN